VLKIENSGPNFAEKLKFGPQKRRKHQMDTFLVRKIEIGNFYIKFSVLKKILIPVSIRLGKKTKN
jgi:hypothetical protein